MEVATPAPVKRPDQFKVIGKSFPRRDIPPKVFGTLQMVNDVRLPGMLHARMIRPTVAGAVPVKVDETSIGQIPGAKVVWIKDLLAVVAEKEWNAVRAARALKVTWSESKPNFPGHERLHDHIRRAPVLRRQIQRENGNVDEGFKQAVRIIEGEYEFPTQSHASTGPGCAVADVRADGQTIWTSTQKPYGLGRVRRRSRRPAARKSDGTLAVGHRLVRPQRSGRRRRRRRRAVEASRPAGARAVHASRGHCLGPERHRLGQSRQGGSRRERQGHRLRVHQQGLLAPRRDSARERGRRRAGRPSVWVPS